MEELLYLNCPFAEKEEVKQLGAKFDWKQKKWFIPPGLESEPFAKWLPKTAPESVDELDDKSFTLNDLLLNVQKTLTTQHNIPYWVRAEVVHISENVHIYMELADHDSAGHEIAKARANLWQYRATELLAHFEEQTGLPFKAGIKVLLQVQVDFHTRYGLSLEVLDIDPNFTLGEIQAKLNRIRAQLKEEGLFERNQAQPQATEFCQVAVIAPPSAAGLGDFKSQAAQLVEWGLCEFHYYAASFQGQKIRQEIPTAFELVNQDHKQKQFDAVVMIRGGGAKADLLQLNEYEIAKAICTAQLPVIVGIGHERDKTLLDEIANQVCHTPSLVITHITSTIIQNARNAQQDWQTIGRLSTEILNNAKTETERLNTHIREQAVKWLNTERQQLESLLQLVTNAGQNQLKQASHQIQLCMEQVLHGDPKMILKRGYAIIRNQQNQVITSKAQAQSENTLVIEFKDGHINYPN